MDGVTVNGSIDLAGVQTVRGVFKCRRCIFQGQLRAADVTFSRTVDLSGVLFGGSVDFHGATFEAPALFRALAITRRGRSTKLAALFEQRADFSLAVFNDFASFAGSRFRRPVDFRDARFADAAFASTRFEVAAFDRVSFRGAALFNNADFRGEAGFTEAGFRDRADFSVAKFKARAVFTRAQFANGASFLAAQFWSGDRREEAARFDRVASGGDLDFTFAVFQRSVVRRDQGERRAPTSPSPIAAFTNLVAGGSMVLREWTLAERHELNMNRLRVHDLVMDVDLVDHINDPDNRLAVLNSIEESAKARGDLSSANDAHYALRVLRSAGYSDFWRVLDTVFYRGIAGYFVRPLRPIAALLSLALVLTILRLARRRSERVVEACPSGRWRRYLRAAGRRCSDALTCFLDTLARALPNRGGDGTKEPALGERLEVISYRVLGVCALLGLANSNPTLRQMVDTLV